MKTRLLTLLAAVVAICCAESLQAQMIPSGGMMPPNMGQGYGGPQAYLPVPQGFGQQGFGQQGFAPQALAAQGMMMPGMAPQGFAPMGAPAAYIPASPALAPPTQVVPSGAYHDVKGGGKGCQSCGGKGGKCCSPLGWDPGWAFHGEFLYWRARDSEVAWGEEINSNGFNPPIQVSPIAVADMDYQPGWRAGFSRIMNECTRINVEYTMWESGSSDAIQRQNLNNVISSRLVSHPGVATGATDHINATAQYDTALDMVDVELQRAYYYDSDVQLSWLMGVRAVTHEAQFNASYFGQVSRTVDTDIDFNGVGPRFGLDAEYALSCQWLTYGSMFGSIIPGTFATTYTQVETPGPATTVNTAWKAGRVITMWDLELGVARVSRCKNYRVNVGYTLSAWTNMVQTDEWIQGVQTNNFIGMDSTSTLDGLVVRAEARF